MHDSVSLNFLTEPASARQPLAAASVYAPDLNGPGALLDEPPTRQGLTFGLITVFLMGTGGGLFTLFGAQAAPPVIEAEPGPYKIVLAQAPVRELPNGMIDLRPPPLPPSAPSTTDAPAENETPPAPSERGPGPGPSAGGAGDGSWLAQVAAMRSQGAAAQAWQRLAADDPEAFVGVEPDIERADLGAQGVYFRVRAGYFDQREQASQFCERVRAMGQDCIVVAR